MKIGLHYVTLNGFYDENNLFEKKVFLRVVVPVGSFKIIYCDIPALEHAYALKIRV